jgi:hypothetical protein
MTQPLPDERFPTTKITKGTKEDEEEGNKEGRKAGKNQTDLVLHSYLPAFLRVLAFLPFVIFVAPIHHCSPMIQMA